MKDIDAHSDAGMTADRVYSVTLQISDLRYQNQAGDWPCVNISESKALPCGTDINVESVVHVHSCALQCIAAAGFTYDCHQESVHQARKLFLDSQPGESVPTLPSS